MEKYDNPIRYQKYDPDNIRADREFLEGCTRTAWHSTWCPTGVWKLHRSYRIFFTAICMHSQIDNERDYIYGEFAHCLEGCPKDNGLPYVTSLTDFDILKPSNGKCYAFSKAEHSKPAAENECSNMGWTVATYKTPEDIEAVREVLTLCKSNYKNFHLKWAFFFNNILILHKPDITFFVSCFRCKRWHSITSVGASWSQGQTPTLLINNLHQ